MYHELNLNGHQTDRKNRGATFVTMKIWFFPVQLKFHQPPHCDYFIFLFGLYFSALWWMPWFLYHSPTCRIISSLHKERATRKKVSMIILPCRCVLDKIRITTTIPMNVNQMCQKCNFYLCFYMLHRFCWVHLRDEIKSLFKISGNIMKSDFIQCKMIKKLF